MNLLRYFISASTMESTNNDGDNPSVGSKRPQRESEAEMTSQDNETMTGRGGFLRFWFSFFSDSFSSKFCEPWMYNPTICVVEESYCTVEQQTMTVLYVRYCNTHKIFQVRNL